MFQIEIIDGDGHLVHQVPLADKPISFGRDPKCAVCIPEISVSRQHALIEPYGNFYIVKDLGSTNGTWINEKPIKSHILRAGDLIQLGAHRIIVSETRSVVDRRKGETRIVDSTFTYDDSRESEHTLRLEHGDELAALSSNEKRLERLVRLQEISQSISLIETPEVLHQKVLEIVLLELEADRISLLLVDSAGTLRPVAALSVLDDDPEEIFALHKGVLRTVTEERTGILTGPSDAAESPAAESSSRSDGVRSVLCVPLVTKAKLQGAIYLDRIQNETPFDEEALGLLAVIANHIAVSLTNANLFQDVLAEKRKVQSIIDNLHDGLVIANQDLVIEKFNIAAARMLAGKSSNLNGKNLLELLHVLDRNFDESRFFEAVESHGTFKMLVQIDGSLHAYVVSVAPFPDSDDNGSGIIFSFRDYTGFINLESLKSEFIRTASHKLRTPLTVLLGSLELLRDELRDGSEDSLGSLLDGMETNVEQLQSLVDRFVEFTELDKHSEVFTTVDIEELVKISWAGLDSKAKAKKIVLVVEKATDKAIRVPGSSDRLTQCITNLFDNAIKYSRVGAEIHVHLAEDIDSFVVSIGDEGTGIPIEKLPYIFSGLYQVESPSRERAKGAGLGLTIARRILHAHGATIRAASPDPHSGKGTLFTITFPKERPATPHSIYLETDLIPDTVL